MQIPNAKGYLQTTTSETESPGSLSPARANASAERSTVAFRMAVDHGLRSVGRGKIDAFRDLLWPSRRCAIKHVGPASQAANSPGDRLCGDGAAGIWRPPPHGPARPPAAFTDLDGVTNLRSVIEVDQAPIARRPAPRRPPTLGCSICPPVLRLAPRSEDPRYTASASRSTPTGGRARPAREQAGSGWRMAFMPDTYLPCEGCGGLRYGTDLADITWKGKNVGQVLQLTFEEAARFFDFHARLGEVCRLMCDCGLGYLTLGQSSPTLSGGRRSA